MVTALRWADFWEDIVGKPDDPVPIPDGGWLAWPWTAAGSMHTCARWDTLTHHFGTRNEAKPAQVAGLLARTSTLPMLVRRLPCLQTRRCAARTASSSTRWTLQTVSAAAQRRTLCPRRRPPRLPGAWHVAQHAASWAQHPDAGYAGYGWLAGWLALRIWHCISSTFPRCSSLPPG